MKKALLSVKGNRAFIFYSILVILKDDGRIAVVEADPGDNPLYKIGAYLFADKDTPMYYFACDKLAYERGRAKISSTTTSATTTVRL